MSEYSENHAVNDTCLTIINDGDGEMCGYTYEQRKNAARRHGLFEFRHMCRNYSRYRHRVFESRHLTRVEVIEAASILFHYYEEHVKECDKHAQRSADLGSSDAPVVLGVSPHATPYQLYLRKLGVLPEIEDSEVMQRGRQLGR